MSDGRSQDDATAAARDAFSETVNPEHYVPRVATESLLASIDQWRTQDRLGSSLAALVTQPGIGKTFFLRLVESRINSEAASAGRSKRALYLPYAGLSFVDLAAWVYGLLGNESPYPSAQPDVEQAIVALFALAGGPSDPFFLLIDDADSMPDEMIEVLGQRLPAESSPLRILAVLGDDARSSDMLGALGRLEPSVAVVRKPLSEDETASYLWSRIRRVGLAEEAVGGLDINRVSRIHALSGGVPREIHRVMTAVVDARAKGLPDPLNAETAEGG